MAEIGLRMAEDGGRRSEDRDRISEIGVMSCHRLTRTRRRR